MKTPPRFAHSLTRGVVLLSASAGAIFPSAVADTFGTGANAFSIDFVTIGNPGNVADTKGDPNPAGSVENVFWMGTYEVSRDMITKANSAGSLGISLYDMTRWGGNGVNRPASGVSWNEAARFVNWLNESSGYSAAYKFATQPGENDYNSNANISLWQAEDAGYNAANPYRNSNAHYFLPSTDEWYKAAYYNPVSGTYFKFATGSDSSPDMVAGGITAGTAVYFQEGFNGPADIKNAGGLSPYGTMAQGGNVFEWNETAYLGINDNAGFRRVFRGASWVDYVPDLQSSRLYAPYPEDRIEFVGFRVAAVPEPEQYAAAFGAALLVGGIWLQRKKVQGVPAK